MTEEERREMTRSNYAAQMETLGYDESGNPLDMVHVVRCRDCKYYAINRLTKAYEPDKRFNPSVCIIGEFARPRKPDWYCADGERRDDDAADRR